MAKFIIKHEDFKGTTRYNHLLVAQFNESNLIVIVGTFNKPKRLPSEYYLVGVWNIKYKS